MVKVKNMSDLVRASGRRPDQLRVVRFETGVNIHAEGSCLVSYGNTKVLCTASVESTIPPFLRNTGRGWVTAEYNMLPRATDTRNRRERDKPSGRTAEIQRLIGRSLRSIVDTKILGERSIVIDCDVLQADGGTRTAAISGGYVALAIAIRGLQANGEISSSDDPLTDSVAAVSVGIYEGRHLLDIDFKEDSNCEVDMNLVMTGSGKFVEVQGTAESSPFDDNDLLVMTSLGKKGLRELMELQRQAIAEATKSLSK